MAHVYKILVPAVAFAVLSCAPNDRGTVATADPLEVKDVAFPEDSDGAGDEQIHKEQYAASHILISHAGSEDVPQKSTRSKKQARQFAELLKKKVDGGAVLGYLARTHSDCVSSQQRSGYLGVFEASQKSPAFIEALKQLEIGQMSEVVAEIRTVA